MIAQGYISFNGNFENAGIFGKNYSQKALLAQAHVRTSGSVPLLLDLVIQYINNQLFLTFSKEYKIDYSYLQHLITKLLNKNRSLKGGLVQINLLAEPAQIEAVDVLLLWKPLDNYHFEVDRKGLVLDIFTQTPKPTGALYSLPLNCDFLFTLAKRQAASKQADELIILNPSKNLACGINSTIYIVKENSIFTPSQKDGALIPIFNSFIKQFCEEKNIEFNNNQALSLTDIILCDEIFLADMVNGIRWVVAYADQRFFNKTALQLGESLDNYAFGAE
jgi:branched-chain amino acid aminotransferase